MPGLRALSLLPLLCLLTVGQAPRPAVASDFLLERSKVSIVSANKRRMRFRARWRGESGTPAPGEATLRVVGGPGEGDSGLIRLPREGWSVRKKGKLLRYKDPTGAAGGIRKILLKTGRKGGVLRIDGGKDHWAYEVAGPQSRVAVILSLSGSRWCAELRNADLVTKSGRVRGKAPAAPSACPCGDEFASTWEAIQTSLFERHGCTTAACHGASPGQGSLDLRSDAAYANLVGVAAAADPAIKRVQPGDPEASMLWRKLAARIRDDVDIPNSPMPLGTAAPLSEDELGALAEWIYNGAPERSVVPGTAQQLSSCLPPPEPQKITPPEAPDPSEGVEFHSPPWAIPIGSEDEVCFAYPYDFSDLVPEQDRFPCPDVWGGPGMECFAYDRIALTQDPNSHHSIWRPYRGASDLTDPAWGAFECRGGDQQGAPCDPTRLDVAAPLGGDCGTGGVCVTKAKPALACIGFGPFDVFAGLTLEGAETAAAPSIIISTEPFFEVRYPTGVANVSPISGIMIVNSHAFNETDQFTTNEQWLQVFYPDPAERRYAVQDIFDAPDIFITNVPPFEEREYCRTLTLDKGTHLFEIYSHTHKRGRLFRAWLPPITTECTSRTSACLPEPGPATLVTTDFSDPDTVVFDPPLVLDSDDPAMRRLKYCAIYDNGFTDPTDVKRRSIAIQADALYKCAGEELVCTGGPNKGLACGNDDANCPDAACDACSLRGGVSTDDEMFILLGSFYCPENTTCYEPLL